MAHFKHYFQKKAWVKNMNFRFRFYLILLLSSLVLACDTDADKSVSHPAKWTHIQSGIASWYGSEQQGKLTANGETFDRHQFTAASRRLPFNSLVLVINRNNGRSVEVRINDRGPYCKGRVLDLSEAAAKSLDVGKSGVVPVDIKVKSPEEETGTMSYSK